MHAQLCGSERAAGAGEAGPADGAVQRHIPAAGGGAGARHPQRPRGSPGAPPLLLLLFYCYSIVIVIIIVIILLSFFCLSSEPVTCGRLGSFVHWPLGACPPVAHP